MHAFVSYIGSSYNEPNLNIERTVQCVPLSLNLEALENQPWRELGDDYLPSPPSPPPLPSPPGKNQFRLIKI